MRILHVIRSVNLTEGGPIESLIRSEPAWARLGHTREVASLDLPDDPWAVDCPLPVHALGHPAQRRWVGHVPWLRYGFTPHLVPWLRAHARRFDIVVVNGLWNYAAFGARRVLPALGVPYVVFTHGMLDPWFRKAYPLKHAGKQLVWWASEGPLTRHARAVLFTSDGEHAAAAGAFWPSHYRGEVVGYGTSAPPPPSPEQVAAFRAAVPALRRPFLLFLGRLHPKKGCDLLLQAFARTGSDCDGLDLVMAGPDRDGEEARLRRLTSDLGIADRVHWADMLRDDAKWGALHGCDAFALPSHGENFGIAVAEAMACGKPVLISDRVNIASTILAAQAGLVAPDTVEGTHDLLHRFAAMAGPERKLMGERARHCFESCFNMDDVVGRTAETLAAAALPRAPAPRPASGSPAAFPATSFGVPGA